MQIFLPYKSRILYAVTNRANGVSKSPYDSLNLALHVGDNPKDVLKNREIVANKFGFYIQNLIYMEQTHNSNIVRIDDPLKNKIEKCDGIITNVKNIPLMVMVADCVPILFYDPKNHVVAVVHAGRNGTFLEIAKKMALKMRDEYGSDLNELLVHIGISIGVCCYEVGEDLADIAIKSFGKEYVEVRDRKFYLDLKRLNQDQLLSIGVDKDNIEISPTCTSCDKNYFSYRRDGVTGRFAGIMMLR